MPQRIFATLCVAALVGCNASVAPSSAPDANAAQADAATIGDSAAFDAPASCSGAALRAVDTTRKCLLMQTDTALLCIDSPRTGKGVYVLCAFEDHKMYAAGSISPPVHTSKNGVSFAPVETARTLGLPVAASDDDAQCRAMPFSPTGAPLPDCP